MLALSGRVGSGKTTLATKLTDELGWVHASYGEYVRLEASKLGLGEQRETLQAVGEELISMGWDAFTRATLEQAGWTPDRSIVVEGIRHVEALNSLRHVTDTAHLVHFHLGVARDVQLNRLRRARSPELAARVTEWETHSTEKQVLSDLPKVADAVLDASLPVQELSCEVNDYITNFDNLYKAKRFVR